MAATLGEDVGVTGVRLCSSWCGPVTGERSGTGLCAGGRVAREHTSTPETMTLRQRAQRADRPAHRNGLTMLGIRLAEGPTGPSVTALDTPDGATALEVAFTAASRRWPRPPAPGTSLRSALGWWRGRGWLLTDLTAGWARLSYRRAAELFERATTPLATAAGQSTGWPLHQPRHSALTTTPRAARPLKTCSAAEPTDWRPSPPQIVPLSNSLPTGSVGSCTEPPMLSSTCALVAGRESFPRELPWPWCSSSAARCLLRRHHGCRQFVVAWPMAS